MYSFQLRVLKNFCTNLSKIIQIENDIKSKVNEKKIISFLLKTHKSIIIFFKLNFIIFNILSYIFFFKKFLSLDHDQKIRLKRRLFFFKFLKTSIIFEILHAIIVLNVFNNEKIIKKKISSRNCLRLDENFIENIVIGSGPGGSITALELLKNNKKCLLIEKGEYWELGNKKHPFEEFENKWQYSGLTATLDGKMIQYSSANCLGGGSEINSGLYHSLSTDFLKKYSGNLTNDQIDNTEIEKIVNFNIEGKKFSDSVKNLKKYFNDGKENLNLKSEIIPRFQNKEYIKNSMTKTYVSEYLSKGGKVMISSEVVKIKKLSKQKYEIKILCKKKIKLLYCKNIFVCCGAPYSYNLLDKNKLIKNKMKNFHFHPMIKLIAKYPKEVNEEISMDVISEQVINFYPKYIFGSAASGLPFLLIPTFQNLKAYNDVKKNFKKMTIFHSTFSFGEGKLLKIPFIKDFFIRYKYKNNNLKTVEEALENLLKFVFSSGAKKIYVLDKNVTEISKEDYYRKNYSIISKNLNFSSVHLLGGIEINKNNISEYGKIMDENIYINDSSLISNDLLKNPQGTIMSICKRNINNILKYDLNA
jgi:hypothetical protein